MYRELKVPSYAIYVLPQSINHRLINQLTRSTGSTVCTGAEHAVCTELRVPSFAVCFAPTKSINKSIKSLNWLNRMFCPRSKVYDQELAKQEAAAAAARQAATGRGGFNERIRSYYYQVREGGTGAVALAWAIDSITKALQGSLF
jgi:hypothetical protein